jgi:hypothetical protein
MIVEFRYIIRPHIIREMSDEIETESRPNIVIKPIEQAVESTPEE